MLSQFSRFNNEQIIIIIAIIILPLITVPIVLSKKLESTNNKDLRKKLRLVMSLSIVSSFLIPVKIYINNCDIIENTAIKILNAFIAIILMVFISLINGIWWELYHKYYDMFGTLIIYMLLLSTAILAWIPLSLKNTLWPDELAECINDPNFRQGYTKFTNNFTERFNNIFGRSTNQISDNPESFNPYSGITIGQVSDKLQYNYVS